MISAMRRRDLALACVFAVGSLPAQDWPAWRGPAGDGVAPEQSAPLTWDREKNIKWKVPLARPGNGSPIVSRGRIFLTMPGDEGGKKRSLHCFDREDGKQLWARTVEFDSVMPTHRSNPHCSTTPVTDGERVVVWHASAGLYCYSFAGEQLWQRELGQFRHMWGHGTSPILHRGRIILHSGPGEKSFVAAFSLATGETIWKTPEPGQLTAEQIEKKRLVGSWCTPLIHHVEGRDLVLCGQPTRIVAYDAEDGAIVWWCAGVSCERGDLTYSSPVVADGVCLIMGGYVGPSIGVRVDGEGDVTETHRVWRLAKQMSNCGSGVSVDGHVYIPDMGSLVSCIDAATGEVAWKKRVGRGESWGSIIFADGRLYMMSQSGTTFVFEANSSKLVILAENELDEPTNSTPAFSDGEIFLRTHENLYCVAPAR